MSRMSKKFATVNDQAEKYSVSPDVVYRKVDAGTWPASRIGRLIRFSPDQQDEIERLVTNAGYRPASEKDELTAALLHLTA